MKLTKTKLTQLIKEVISEQYVPPPPLPPGVNPAEAKPAVPFPPGHPGGPPKKTRESKIVMYKGAVAKGYPVALHPAVELAKISKNLQHAKSAAQSMLNAWRETNAPDRSVMTTKLSPNRKYLVMYLRR